MKRNRQPDVLAQAPADRCRPRPAGIGVAAAWRPTLAFPCASRFRRTCLALLLLLFAVMPVEAAVKYVILKADDMVDAGGTAGPGRMSSNWTAYTDIISNKGVKANIGIIGSSCNYANGAAFWTKMAELLNSGRFEFFNHGYNHIVYTNYTQQWQHDDMVANQTLVQSKLGVTMIGMGLPENAYDATTAAAINSIPDFKFWIYGDQTRTTKIALARDGEIENPLFVPNFALFQANYATYTNRANAAGRDYLCFQMHPNQHDDTRRTNLCQIIDFLLADGKQFVTLSEYLAISNPTAVMPAAPTALVATPISAVRIDLQWTDSDNRETGFRIEHSTDSNTWTAVAAVPANTTTASDTGLAPLTTYYYRVAATNATGLSGYSGVAAATTYAEAALPTAPTGLAATATAPDTVSLSWSGTTTDVTGYVIERATDAAFTAIQATWTTAADVTTFSDSGLVPQTACFYRVRALNHGGESPNSNIAGAVTPAWPAAEIVLTNTAASVPFASGSNWDPSRVPGTLDTAIFTNNIAQTMTCPASVLTAAALFRQKDIAQASALAIAAGMAWTITNRLVIGESAGQAAAVVVASSGTLAVTNAAHDAQLVVGPAGVGKLTLSGGTLMVDRLIATNNSSAATNALLAFTGGTLITSNAASQMAATFTVPASSTFDINNTWNMLGGSNRIASADAGGNTASFVIGHWVNACTVHVTRAALNLSGSALSVGWGSINNTFWVDGAIVTNVGTFYVGDRFGGSGVAPSGNALVITNGGQLWGKSSAIVGYSRQNTSLASNNRAVVTGASSLWNAGGTALSVGANNSSGRPSRTNTLTVTSGGALTNVALLLVGSCGGDIAAGNQLVVTNGGQVFASGVQTGNNVSNAFDNSVLVVDGGLLEANALTNYPGSTNNTIRNVRGVYQFTTAAPKLVPNGAGSLTLADGTISFRAMTNADVLANLGSGALSGITCSGTNAFRLNGASNTVASAQSYVFDPGFGPTNYARLEMVNGATRYRGQPGNTLTIGAAVGTGGQMFCSNTTARVDLPFTNNGTLTLVSSTLSLATNALVNGTVAMDFSSLLQASNLTLNTVTSTLVLPPGAAGTSMTLVACSGALSGRFGAAANVPSGYTLRYVNGTTGSVQLAKATILVILVK